MKDLVKNCRVAVIEAAPVVFDKDKTVEKAVGLICKAAEDGAQIVVFSEVFICGYPRGLSFGIVPGKRPADGREDWKRLYDSSIIVPGPEMDKIAEAAKNSGVYVCMGYTERDPVNYTLYCGYAYISSDGKLLGKHRKVKPTGMERCLWGEGSADMLKAVDTPWGPMGALCCWENLMPLARVAMYQQGVTIYLAPTMSSDEVWHCDMRHIAREGKCFVITSAPYMTKEMFKGCGMNYSVDDHAFPEDVVVGGRCAVIGPDGYYITPPSDKPVDILYADLDMDQITLQRMDFDPTGHYSRPDLFRFHVNCD